jgi:orotate phosphoribosyltransferase-like protein
MPHFSTVLESERELYKDDILQVLTTHFMQNRKVHKDVRWRNIGKYKSRNGAIALVVFDLHDVVDYNVDAHHDWIENAMNSLYVNV